MSQKVFILMGVVLIVISPFCFYYLIGPITKLYCDVFNIGSIGCGIYYLPIIGLIIFLIPALIGSMLILLSFRKLRK